MSDAGSGLMRRHVLGGAMIGLAIPLLPRTLWAKPAHWQRVVRITEDYVSGRKLPGAVAAMGFGQDMPDIIARGKQALEVTGPVNGDSLFRIYSMTKPVTGMAAMILVDEGRLALDQPVSEILPEFADMKVQRVPDGRLDDLVPASRPITIRHLLTHTAGLGYSIVQKGPIRRAYEAAGLVPGAITRLPLSALGLGVSTPVKGLDQFAKRLARMPLVHQPGTKWSYSVSLDLMGRVIEVASGQPFDAFMRERFFEPLGMRSTFFRVPRSEQARLTSNYGVVEGLLLPIDPGSYSVFLDAPAFPFGGSGLVSTPNDYDRFLRMLLGGGKFAGTRVMSEAAVRIGTSNLLPPGVKTEGTFANGGGFGAGGRVGLGREAGTFGWAGAAGTIAFADLKRGWRGGFYAQFMPADAWPIQRSFPEAAMQDALEQLGETRS